MKHVFRAALAFILALSLTACGNPSDRPAVWEVGSAQAILDSGAFSEALEELDADTAFILYHLAEYGLERETLTAAFVRRSAGGTCEELAVLEFDQEDSAKTAQDALKDYIQNQIEANTDYRPAEIPKLEHAWINQRDHTLLLVVANDLDAAKAAVEQ